MWSKLVFIAILTFSCDASIASIWTIFKYPGSNGISGPVAFTVDPSGSFHIAYCTSQSQLYYLTNHEGYWRGRVVDSGCASTYTGISIAADSNHIAYILYSHDARTVYFASNKNGQWQPELLDTDSELGSYGVDGLTVRIQPPDIVHAAYQSYMTAIHAVRQATGPWAIHKYPLHSLRSGRSGFTFDADYRVHMCYPLGHATENSLEVVIQYGAEASESWKEATASEQYSSPGPPSTLSYRCSIAVDSEKNAHIVFLPDFETLVYSVVKFDSGQWSTSNIDKSEGLRYATISIAVDPTGHPQVAYSPADGMIHYSEFESGKWNPNMLDVGGYVFITATPQGTAVIASDSLYAIRDPSAPELTTKPVGDVGGSTAVINGAIQAPGPGNYRFEYGPCPSVDLHTPFAGYGVGSSDRNYLLQQLKLQTHYCYRIAALRTSGTTVGYMLDFTTLAYPGPSLTINPPTDVTWTGATFHGSVNSHGSPTTYWFKYGRDPAHLNKYTEPRLLRDAIPVAVTEEVVGLEIGSLQYHQLTAENSLGTVSTQMVAFRTRHPAWKSIHVGGATIFNRWYKQNENLAVNGVRGGIDLLIPWDLGILNGLTIVGSYSRFLRTSGTDAFHVGEVAVTFPKPVVKSRVFTFFVSGGAGAYFLDSSQPYPGFNGGMGLSRTIHPRLRLQAEYVVHTTVSASHNLVYGAFQGGVLLAIHKR